MGYTKAQLEEKNKELRARIKELEDQDKLSQTRISELEAKDAENQGKIKGLEDDKAMLQKRIGALEEQVQFFEAATKSANEDANEQREKAASYKAKLEGSQNPTPAKKDASPDRSKLSPGCRAFLEQAEQMPKKESVISTAAILDNPFLSSFMSNLEPTVDDPVDELAENRSYIDLSSTDEGEEDGEDGEDGEDDDSEGAPYGRSASGEYLDPDEEQ